MLSVKCETLGFFFFQAEDGIRDLVRSRGLGDVYKRQPEAHLLRRTDGVALLYPGMTHSIHGESESGKSMICLLYTSDAADERSSVDLGGRRIIKKKKHST